MCGMRMLQKMRHCLVNSLGGQGDADWELSFPVLQKPCPSPQYGLRTGSAAC